MKRYIYIHLVLIFTGISTINAQDYFSFYNLGDYVVQTQNISPVYIPKNPFTLAIPMANIGFNFNSGFKINELLVQNESTKLLAFDLKNLHASAEEYNYMNVDFNINIFCMAFKREKGSLTIFANTKITNNLRYSKDFLEVIANGITKSFSLTEQNNYTGYHEIGIGFTQTFLNDKLALAIRAKYLNGFMHSSTEDGAKLSLSLDDASANYLMNAQNLTLNTSGSVFTDSQEFKTFTGNSGIGFDFGTTFKATNKLTLEIALNDIGFINWKEDVKNYNIKDVNNEEYSGIDLRDIEGAEEGEYDFLNSLVTRTETELKFNTKLSMKTYVSARYAITDKNTFTLAMFNTNAFDEFKPSYSLGYNRTLDKTTYGVLASKKGVNNDFFFGANFALKLGPIQLYAATDSLKALFEKIEEFSGANVRLGLNFIFDYNE